MGFMSKIFSCVINVRCFNISDSHGTMYQFCGMPKIGCNDGLFTIKNLLNVINNYNLPTFVDFVNIVKAFDTASQKLLIKVLEIYGSPPKFFSDIHIMYQDLIVVLKIGNSIEEIIQEVRVIQVDNMAPVIFLFLMDAFSEILSDTC